MQNIRQCFWFHSSFCIDGQILTSFMYVLCFVCCCMFYVPPSLSMDNCTWKRFNAFYGERRKQNPVLKIDDKIETAAECIAEHLADFF